MLGVFNYTTAKDVYTALKMYIQLLGSRRTIRPFVFILLIVSRKLTRHLIVYIKNTVIDLK